MAEQRHRKNAYEEVSAGHEAEGHENSFIGSEPEKQKCDFAIQKMRFQAVPSALSKKALNSAKSYLQLFRIPS